MARRGYSETAALTYLAADVTAGATSFTAQDVSTWAGIATNGPFIVTLDRGRASEERLLCTTINTTTGVISGATRGYHGTTAVAHTAAVCTVEHTSAAVDFDEANGHINDTTLDHHTQYVRTNGSRTITGAQAFSATISVTGSATLLSATNKVGRGSNGAANGYAQIGDDGNGALIAAKHGTATDTDLTLMSLGGGKISLQTSGAAPLIEATDVSGSGSDTGLWLRHQGAGAATFHRVVLGAADSAGTGFRTMRLPN